MDISTIISKETIFLNLKADSREDVLSALIGGMENQGHILDRTAYLAAVNERESKGSTGIGFGVAIPHGKSAGVKDACIAFARLSSPVEWKSFDGKPVNCVFLIAVPEANAGNDHLKILIAISKKLMHEDFRTALLQAQTEEDILKLLRSIEA